MGAYAMPHLPEFHVMDGMTEQQRTVFVAQYGMLRKDSTAAILLAFFLGSFGAHRFYLGETGMGILYLCFFWTGVPHLVAFVECFLLPERVRRYNALHAAAIAAGIRGGYAPDASGIMVSR